MHFSRPSMHLGALGAFQVSILTTVTHFGRSGAPPGVDFDDSYTLWALWVPFLMTVTHFGRSESHF